MALRRAAGGHNSDVATVVCRAEKAWPSFVLRHGARALSPGLDAPQLHRRAARTGSRRIHLRAAWTLLVYGHDYASAPAPVGGDDDDEASVMKLAVIVGVAVLVLAVLVAAAVAATRRRAPVEPALGAQTAHPTKEPVQNPVTTP